MTAVIQFTPLWGAKSEDPLCYLLEIDDFCFLLDCGWTDKFDVKQIEPLKDVIRKIDAVLLTHPDLSHLGALPYAVGKLGLAVPVYCTLPVWKMGQMFMYDIQLSRKKNEDFDVFDLDDVDEAFELCKQLKFSQHLKLAGKGQGITITPYSAGHMLGGTIWKISKETEEIVYAVDYHRSKERHLDPTVLETLTRPTLLITDAYNALVRISPRKDRDAQLVDNILSTVRGGGNVLMPVDSAGRVFELLVLLDQYWSANHLATYPLALLHNVAGSTVDHAKSHLEWCSEEVMKRFDSTRENPFGFRYVQLCHSRDDLDALPSPKVVLATPASCNTGFSQELFVEWAQKPKNTVIFTDRSDPASLTRTIIAPVLRNLPPPPSVIVNVWKRSPLQGQELVDWQEQERLRHEQEQRKKRLVVITDAMSMSTTEDFDYDLMDIDKPTEPSAHVPRGEYGSVGAGGRAPADLVKAPSSTPRTLRLAAKKRFLMYELKDKPIEYDEYGETIKPEDFVTTLQHGHTLGDGPAEGRKDGPSDEAEPKMPEIPTKCAMTAHKVEVLCRVLFVDFEARSDGGSIKKILTNVRPRRMILIHGSEEATMALAETWKKEVNSMVYTPSVGECVNVTSDTKVFKVKMKESLVASMAFSKVLDYEVTYMDALVCPSEGSGHTVLDVVPPKDTPTHAAIYVGDIKLADFKQTLAKTGLQTGFRETGSIETADGNVTIRKKVQQHRVTLEGALCDDFFKVRELLYAQYTIL